MKILRLVIEFELEIRIEEQKIIYTNSTKFEKS
jgi:hypothetical protein